MLHSIVDVDARPEYRLWLQFEDGVEGVIDLSDLVGRGVFAAWTDLKVFQAVTIDLESGTVAWPHGIDLAPDTLYQELAGIKTG